MVVTNNTEEVNGTTMSLSALIADPWPDGISLPEAMWAALSVSRPYTILFASSLKGTTIAVDSSLRSLDQDDIAINGDMNGDGTVDLADAVLVLKIVSALDTPDSEIVTESDVSGDERTGQEETIYIL
jgi:hypothetical protein